MGYNTANTSWPATTPPANVKALIDNLFLTLDNNKSTAGDILADDIFAPDGVLNSPQGKVEGSEQIRRCRDHAWKMVKQRRHKVNRVYVHDNQATDLLLIGTVEMALSNGKQVRGEFTARVLFTELGSDALRVKLYQVWADSAPMLKALESD